MGFILWTSLCSIATACIAALVLGPEPGLIIGATMMVAMPAIYLLKGKNDDS